MATTTDSSGGNAPIDATFLGQSVFALLRVWAGFTLVLVLVPYWVLGRREDEATLLRAWRALVAGTAFWIVLIHVLAWMRAFEWLGLLPIAGLICWLVIRVRRMRTAQDGSDAPWVRSVGYAFQQFESARPDRLVRQLCRRAGAAVGAAAGVVRDGRNVLIVLVLALSGWLRLKGPLEQAAPGASDGYVHLLWTNLLLRNHLFPQGVYSEGYHAVAAAIATLFFMDPLQVLRFLGPLAGLLMVAGVYTLAKEISGNQVAALAAAACFGLSTSSPLPEAAWRQMNPLPQEFAAAFVPIGIVWALRWLQGGNRRDLTWLALTAAVTAAIHPYGTLFLAIAVMMLALSANAGRRRMLAAPLSFMAGAFLGTIPVVLGVGLGLHVYAESGSYALRPHAVGALAAGAPSPLRPFLVFCLVLGLVLIILGLQRKACTRASQFLGLGLTLLVLTGVDMAGNTGLPFVPEAVRTDEFLSLLVVPAAFAVLSGGWLVRVQRQWLAPMAALAVVVPVLVVWPPRPPVPTRQEPVGAAQTYLRIQRTFKPWEWTIVSPVEQVSQASYRGWHVELSDFVRDLSPAEAADPRFYLKDAHPGGILTPDVLLYVEPRPFGLQRSISPVDLSTPLAPVSDTEPYRGENRAAIEARAYAWAIAYLRAHPDSTRIYFQTPELVVFWIHQ